MKQTEIENIKGFTNALFAGTTFDAFCVTEASFSTLVNITIDGHVNREFLQAGKEENIPEDESADNIRDVVTWHQIRPLCYEAVKGSSKPLRFKIIFMTPPDRVEGFISRHGLNVRADDVTGLFMNIRFEGGSLNCISGTSVKSFSLDKSLENAWDESVEAFIKKFA